MIKKRLISNICSFKLLLTVGLIFLFSSTVLGYSKENSYEPGLIIVKEKALKSFTTYSDSYKKKFKEKYNIKKIRPIKLSSKGIRLMSVEKLYVYEVDSSKDIEKLAKELKKEEDILYAEPNYYVYSFQLPNDYYLYKQDYIIKTNIYKALSLPVLSNILVAVVDSGIDFNHTDIKDNIFYNSKEQNNQKDDDQNSFVDDIFGYNFCGYSREKDNNNVYDDFGHGTHIAGIIGAKTNNHLGIVGLNSKINVLNVKFLDITGRGTQLDAAAAIKYAVDMGARLINCSWGFYRYSSVLKEAIEYAISKDVIVVAAAGNSSSSMVEYPAGFEGVITVSSIDLNMKRSSFSSLGSHIDFAEYGQSIFGLLPQDKYGTKSGTSQSSAILSGLISRVIASKPELTATQVKNVLIKAAKDICLEGKDIYSGYGRVDIVNLIEILEYDDLLSEIPDYPVLPMSSTANLNLSDVMNFPNPFGSEGTRFGFSSSGGDIRIRVYNARGRLQKTINDNVTAGYVSLLWDGTDETGAFLPNGTYFYVIRLTGNLGTKIVKGKLSILR